jgi:cation:H+ antiporter
MEQAAEISDLSEIPAMTTKKGLLVLLFSLLMLLVSAELLVWSATEIAVRMGISQLIIGLTVIAVGTSLPELVVSVSCALKGQTDLAIGNIVGSNIFNILLVLAIPGLISPTMLASEVLWRDYLLMLMMTLLLVLFAYGVRSKAKITRLEGGFLSLIWIAYLTSLYHSSLL